ncbi:hypothetical protein, partial [Tritonibacter sp. SIMBA_163]|uniref:hypothetical protein n=1 Tax=Tritonibacter sp. SIMBA_163 TaxID=3080868 RepID=UPI00397F814F
LLVLHAQLVCQMQSQLLNFLVKIRHLLEERVVGSRRLGRDRTRNNSSYAFVAADALRPAWPSRSARLWKRCVRLDRRLLFNLGNCH